MSTQEKESSSSSSSANDVPSQLKESPKYVIPTPVPPVPSASSSSSSSGGHVVRPTPTLPTIPLSWQCFSSLMFCGPQPPQKMADNAMVCIAPSVRQLWCFVVSPSHLSPHSTITVPFPLILMSLPLSIYVVVFTGHWLLLQVCTSTFGTVVSILIIGAWETVGGSCQGSIFPTAAEQRRPHQILSQQYDGRQ